MSKEFISCEKCKKKLIEKKSDGVLYFRFGRKEEFIPVEMIIIGALKIKCTRKWCNHWNTVNPFPGDEECST